MVLSIRHRGISLVKLVIAGISFPCDALDIAVTELRLHAVFLLVSQEAYLYKLMAYNGGNKTSFLGASSDRSVIL